VTRLPVAGAMVTLVGPAGFDPAIHLIGGVNNVMQTTGANGAYQFLLQPTAPVGIYSLTIKPPAGYVTSTITPSATPLVPPNRPGGPLLVQPNDGPPTGTQSTIYYVTFNLNPATNQDVVNNHVPVDPVRVVNVNTPIPTLSQWSMMFLGLLMALWVGFNRRKLGLLKDLT
jgi:large repetitive protein